MNRVARYCVWSSVAVALIMVTSCSNKVSNPNYQVGSLTDPAYLEASGVMSQSIDNTQQIVFLEGLGLVYQQIGFPAPPPYAAGIKSDSVLYYAYENGWHHLIFVHVNDTTGSNFHLDDSVQINNKAGMPQQHPDTLDIGSIIIKVKRYANLLAYDSSDVFKFKGQDTVIAAMSLVVNDTTSFTVNGSGFQHAHGTFLHPDSAGVECTVNGELNHAVYNLVMPLKPNPSACVISGQMSASGMLSIVCPFAHDTVTVSGSWSLIVNIGSSTVTFIAQNINTRWIKNMLKSEYCFRRGPVVAYEVLPGRFQE